MDINKKRIEAAAAAIGLEIGPSCDSKWTLEYAPNVRWPDDYSQRERAALRNAAIAALEAAAVVDQ